MSWRTLLVLVLVFGVLGYLTLQREDEKRRGVGISPTMYPVLDGFATERIAAVRVDNLERAVQVGLETDGRGSWFLTDPLAYPAEPGVLTTLFRTLSMAFGAPAGDVDPADVALDPPLVVLELDQRDEDGTRTWRVDVGGVDLDPDRVFVRVHDHPAAPDGGSLVLRTTRTIYNLLDRNPADYRSRRTTTLLGADVVALHRSGRAWVEEYGGDVDLSLVAEQDGGSWKRTDGPVVTLEPNAVGLIAVGAAQLRVRRFTFDSPEDFGVWGLDDPRFELTLFGRDGERQTLQFGAPEMVGPVSGPPANWYCRRAGYDHVWEVDADDVLLLVRPAEELYSQLLLRSHREDVRRVELQGGGRRLVLEKHGPRDSKRWTVGADDGPTFPADLGRVQDVLSALESTQLEHPADLRFEELDPPLALTIVTEDGVRHGGRLGAEYRDASIGLVGRRFLRYGDELPGVIEETVAELCLVDLGEFRSDRIHRVRGEDVADVSLTHDGRTFRYVHPDEKTWLVAGGAGAVVGTTFDAPRAFVQLTQTLFSLRAERWLDDVDPDAALAGLEVVEVVLTPRGDDAPLAFRLGRDSGGQVLAVGRGRVAQVSETQLAQHADTWGADLVDTLLGLFRE